MKRVICSKCKWEIHVAQNTGTCDRHYSESRIESACKRVETNVLVNVRPNGNPVVWVVTCQRSSENSSSTNTPEFHKTTCKYYNKHVQLKETV